MNNPLKKVTKNWMFYSGDPIGVECTTQVAFLITLSFISKLTAIFFINISNCIIVKGQEYPGSHPIFRVTPYPQTSGSMFIAYILGAMF